ncbi:MAG: hypothetical protein AAF598_12170 [Bacteroidota bacterium]
MKWWTTILLLTLWTSMVYAQQPILDLPEGHNDFKHSLYFSAYGQQLLSNSHDGTLRLRDIKAGKLLKTSEKTELPILEELENK